MLKVFFLTAFHVSIELTISPTFLPSAKIRSGQVSRTRRRRATAAIAWTASPASPKRMLLTAAARLFVAASLAALSDYHRRRDDYATLRTASVSFASVHPH